MKLTFSLLAILALASSTLAYAGDTRSSAMHHEAVAPGSMEMMGGGDHCNSRRTCPGEAINKASDQASSMTSSMTSSMASSKAPAMSVDMLESIYHL